MAPQQVATTTLYTFVPGPTPSLSPLPMVSPFVVPHVQTGSKVLPAVVSIPLYFWFILAFALLLFLGAAVYFVQGFIENRRAALRRRSMQNLPVVQFSPKDEPFSRIPVSYARRFDLLMQQGNGSEVTLVTDSTPMEGTVRMMSDDVLITPTIKVPPPCVHKTGLRYDSDTTIPKIWIPCALGTKWDTSKRTNLGLGKAYIAGYQGANEAV